MNPPPIGLQAFGEAVTGARAPADFVLDACVLDYQDEYKIVAEDIRQNRIVFHFPSGWNQIDLVEECRAIMHGEEDFDLMYDITMQLLAGKDLTICMRNGAGHEIIQTELHITDRYMNLRGNDFIDEYPMVVIWLTEFIGARLRKKCPVLGNDQNAPSQAPKNNSEETAQQGNNKKRKIHKA